MKSALYAYNIPLVVRALFSTILWLAGQDQNTVFYGFQIIIYKFCLFISIIVGFKMKKIQILINFD